MAGVPAVLLTLALGPVADPLVLIFRIDGPDVGVHLIVHLPRPVVLIFSAPRVKQRVWTLQEGASRLVFDEQVVEAIRELAAVFGGISGACLRQNFGLQVGSVLLAAGERAHQI